MTNLLPKAAFAAGSQNMIEKVWGPDQMAALQARCDLYPHRLTPDNLAEHEDILPEVEYLFSTWSMPHFSHEELEKFPKLKAVFYAAGSVQYFARPLLQSNIRVFSAWAANAIPVAEFTLAQMLLSCKGYFRNVIDCRKRAGDSSQPIHSGPGIYSSTVALIGFGMIGRKLADLLRPFHMNVLVVDPYVTDEVLAAHGTVRATLEEAFSTATVVSNHLPNLPATEYMLDGSLFRKMLPHATFINTGRGKQVREDDLIEVLQERPDLTALLDVTYPEPPEPDSPLHTLPNVQLSSHIAGSIGVEVHRLADFMIEEFDLLTQGETPRYQVTEAMLETMA